MNADAKSTGSDVLEALSFVGTGTDTEDFIGASTPSDPISDLGFGGSEVYQFVGIEYEILQFVGEDGETVDSDGSDVDLLGSKVGNGSRGVAPGVGQGVLMELPHAVAECVHAGGEVVSHQDT